jgi:DnaJ-class molecular chaperone
MLCPKCGSKGKLSFEPKCDRCDGKGYVRVFVSGFEASGRPQSDTCVKCRGRGHLTTETVTCDLCAGTGQVQRVLRAVTCPTCKGSGQIMVPTGDLFPSGEPKQRWGQCPHCLGKRTVQEERLEPDFS